MYLARATGHKLLFYYNATFDSTGFRYVFRDIILAAYRGEIDPRFTYPGRVHSERKAAFLIVSDAMREAVKYHQQHGVYPIPGIVHQSELLALKLRPDHI